MKILSFESFKLITEAADNRTLSIQKALKSKGAVYASILGKTGPNGDGLDGKMGPNTISAIKKFQQENGIKQTGFVGNQTSAALGISGPGKDVSAGSASQSAASQSANIPGASNQVNNQIAYLKSINYNKPFTIVDDKNSKVYAINADFSLNKAYEVITGAKKGDMLTTTTFKDWISDNMISKIKDFFTRAWGTSVADAGDYIEQCYLNTELKALITPSGIFKRRSGPSAWLTDKILTFFFEKVYGKKFIGWETMSGEEIPYGFHGTKNPERIDVDLDQFSAQACQKHRKMSYGCINFKEADILNIDKFISDDQVSFWLPNASNGIVKFS
jgi:hypothetical protein